ncbi:MAG TPA: primosomal protein N' [Ruminococcaceae bacterium]|nr:primosomal protein N' [Oscillospiraceae bacterium]
MSVEKIAAVAVENSAFSFDKPFSYLLNDENCMPGCRVLVPFGRGNRCRQGIVLSVAERNGEKGLKKISQVIDKAPVLNDEMLKLVEWLRERTFCTYFEAAKAVLPSGMCHRTLTTYMAAPDADISGCDDRERQIFTFLSSQKGYVEGEKLLKKLGFSPELSLLEDMAKKGLLVRNYDSARRTGDLTVKTVRLTESGRELIETSEKLTKKQLEVLNILSDIGTASVKEVCYFTGFTPSVIQALAKKGLVEIFENEVYRDPYENKTVVPEKKEIILNDEQQTAFRNMLRQYSDGNGGATLLYGVTGSGKTMVYLRLIDEMLERGKNVIVMVPEIALTPQTLNLFMNRYGKEVAVFHSALSAGQRLDEWKRVHNENVRIVVGTRSAVFAPLENIGLIIIDEEQEHTYKSEQTPRYSAKDVARFRCAYHKALLVFSSATPSIETYAKAMSGQYTINRLTKRYSSSELPNVRIVDMLTDALSQSSNFSEELKNRLQYNLDNGRQSILLINRRGYNTFAECKACGHVMTCPSCSISMTYHHANGRLMCHYCGYSEPFTDTCPECGSHDVRYSGTGTQKIEDELSAIFPNARILRMDADSTMGRYSHENKLKDFSDGKYDILLGTQMVAKGLDFENVTLVGVINADQQLNNDDFRSQERTFDLLTQVVGRAGRGKYEGTAVIQTCNPENDVIQIAARQDYDTFFNDELKTRKMLIYPPYCDICLVGFVGENEAKVRSASQKFTDMLKKELISNYSDQKIIALGPMTARVSKISNKFRYRLILKCKNSKRFRALMSDLLKKVGSDRVFGDVSVYIDINPENII